MGNQIRFVMLDFKLDEFEFVSYTNEKMNLVKEELEEVNRYNFFTDDEDQERLRSCIIYFDENRSYFIHFTHIITPTSSQLKIDITLGENTRIDTKLEVLKIKLKDTFIDDWEQCVWLEDRQSEALAENLYKEVHNVENSLRRLINTVLFYKLGGEWWEKYIPAQLKNKYNQRDSAYSERAPSFNNIHTNLLSIDTEDLVKIIFFKTYKLKDVNIFSALEEPLILGFSEPEINVSRRQDLQLFEFAMNNHLNNDKLTEQHNTILKRILQDQMEVDKDFWRDYFAPWLGCDNREFDGKWRNFTKDRNHVAHNKLIDHTLYDRFKRSSNNLLDMIQEAEGKFDVHLKEEMSNYLDALREYEDNEHREQEESYREIKESEANVSIQLASEISEMLQTEIDHSFTALEDEFHGRDDLTTNYSPPAIEDGLDQEILLISHEVFKNELSIVIQCEYIDEQEAGQTTVYFYVYYNKENQDVFKISFINGGAEFNYEQGNYMPTSYDELNTSELNGLHELVKELVDEHMWSTEDIVFASIECEACNEFAVNLHEHGDYIEGHCFSCGHHNKLGECLRCETVIDSNEDGFCENCEAHNSRQ